MTEARETELFQRFAEGGSGRSGLGIPSAAAEGEQADFTYLWVAPPDEGVHG